ncbi:hypothetical protein [Marmoricola sp. URHB0036]|nr:hypothetical protein [Marmoricola sp. URHB0036]
MSAPQTMPMKGIQQRNSPISPDTSEVTGARLVLFELSAFTT